MKGHKNKKAISKGERNQSMEMEEDTLDPGALISRDNKDIDPGLDKVVGRLHKPAIISDERMDIVLKPDKPGVKLSGIKVERDPRLSGGNEKTDKKSATVISGPSTQESIPHGSRIIQLEEQVSTSEKDSALEDFDTGKDSRSGLYPENKRKLLSSPSKFKTKILKKDNSFVQEFPKMDFIQSGVYCGTGNRDKLTNTAASQTHRTDRSFNDTDQNYYNYNNREILYWKRKYTESCKEISNLKEQMIGLEQKLRFCAQLNERDKKETLLDEGNLTGQRFGLLDKKVSYEVIRQKERSRELLWTDSRDSRGGEVYQQGDNRYVSALRAPSKSKNSEVILVKVLDHIMKGLDRVVEDIRTYRCDLFDGVDRTNVEEDTTGRDNSLRRMKTQDIQPDYRVSENFDNLNVDTNQGGGSLKGYHRFVDWGDRPPGRERNFSTRRSDLITDTEDGRSQRNYNSDFSRVNIGTEKNRREVDSDLIALKRKIPRSAVILIRNEGGPRTNTRKYLERQEKRLALREWGLIRFELGGLLTAGSYLKSLMKTPLKKPDFLRRGFNRFLKSIIRG